MEKDYYVYIYLNQLQAGTWSFKEHSFGYQPFYVGKGKNKREKSHLYPSNLEKKSYKNNIIKKILKETREEPIHFRIYENLTNEEAIKIEAELISFFGRIDTKTGILTNLTDGGEGLNNFADKNISKPWARKKVYQYTLDGLFVKEWESISSVDIGWKQPTNISTAIKKGGTWGNSIWSYTKEKSMKPRIKNQMKVTYKNIEQIDKKTEKLINIFENALEIEKKLNLRNGARNKIYECLKGKIKTAYGYKWRLKSL
jgi:predicted DNA-binding protein YlxM (UPF0122 family)